MPEIDNVQTGETIAVEWGNAIRDRTIQRYANAAERAELHPNPTEGDLSYLEDTNSIEVYDGFAWVAGIPNQAVTTAKIANQAVTTPKIAPEAVTHSKIAEGTIGGSRLGDQAVFTAKIADQAVTTDKIAVQAVTTSRIADEAVTFSKIAPGAVSSSRIADGQVTAGKIADQAVTTPKIADQAVTTPKIASEAVTFSRIAPEAVAASRIAGAAISAFERSGATVETSVVVPSSVGNLATVTLNIPSSWSSWECVAFAHATAIKVGADVGFMTLIVRIDGTDGRVFDYQVQGPGNVAAVAASFRSGITTTGNRTIALRGNSSTGGVTLPSVFLYARAFRTS